MKKFLFYIVKYVRWIYSLYFYVGSFAVKLLKLFVRPDDKLILFISFGGRKFDDSPKAIYDRMINDSRFDGYKIVWAFINPDAFDIPKGEKVKCDTFSYFKTALKARVWISNSTVERGLNFNGKHTFYFDTWHGTPMKKMGSDVTADGKSFGGKGNWPLDVFTCQGEYEAEIFARAFKSMPDDAIRVIGLPRNDVFSDVSDSLVKHIREKLQIGREKKVILYAPTFREYDKSNSMECVLNIPFSVEKWREELGPGYVLLFRAHYEVAKGLNIKSDEFIREVSGYPDLSELMIASDMLVSDYSSIFFDYSIMHKPMYAFCYDYDKYSAERGLYFDVREWLPNAADENSLLELINNSDIDMCREKTDAFQKKFVTEYGSATQKSLDIIAENLGI